MAEGLARHLSKGALEVYSAGLEPNGTHPMAITVMDEIPIDIRNRYSKGVDPVLLDQIDSIITVCNNAEAHCPITPPHIRREHWPLKDPAQAVGTDVERLQTFRKTRDEIRERLVLFLERFVL